MDWGLWGVGGQAGRRDFHPGADGRKVVWEEGEEPQCLMNKDSTPNGALPRPPRHPPPPLPESSKGLGTRLCPFLVPLFLGCCARAGDQDGPLPGPNSSQWGGGRKEREVSHFEAWKSDPSLLFPAIGQNLVTGHPEQRHREGIVLCSSSPLSH